MIKIFNLSKSDRIGNSTTSGGNQIKWVTNYNDKLIYIKSDDKGYESVSEALISEFCKYIKGDFRYVDYYLCEIYEDGRHYYGCYSYNMLDDNESLVSFYRLFKLNNIKVQNYKGNDLLRLVISSIKKITDLDITADLQKLINLDAITVNEDRHFNNIALIYKEHTGYTGLSSIFDNGMSLLSNIEDYPLSGKVGSLLLDVRSKPFTSSFTQQVLLFERNPLIIDINGFLKNKNNDTADFGRDRELKRALDVLERRLEKTEGIAWRSI